MPMSTNIHVPWGGEGHQFGFLQAPNQRKICTQTYKESDLDINIPAGSSKVGHRFGALHAPVPH